jgi:transposase
MAAKKRKGSSVPPAQKYTVRDFRKEFPDDEACLEWLLARLYPDGIYCPKCERVTKHHRVASRRSYSCQFCGHHVHPTAGTIFHKSTTPLELWFYAIFVMSQTRCGISAKQLQRELGVTYKTAWRMFNQIRKLLADDESDPPLSGTVEADEAYIGGRRKAGTKPRDGSKPKKSRKDPVFAVVERGGRVIARHVPRLTQSNVMPTLTKYVLPASTVYTDEWAVLGDLNSRGFTHRRVKHGARVYVEGDVHTNTIEGFFSLVKNGIRGVYHSVGTRHLQSYLDEYAFRYNHRNVPAPMFKLVLSQISQHDA